MLQTPNPQTRSFSRKQLYEMGEPFGDSATHRKPGGIVYGGGGGGGGGLGDCFTPDTQVLMLDGTTKSIVDVQVGDHVYNYDRTSCNRVTFIEIADGSQWGSLFSPTTEYPPFATVNHPIYIDGVLSAVDPEKLNKVYPWLGKLAKLDTYSIAPAPEGNVYNLWVTGDGTYTVNGYGTTAGVGDGGLFRILFESGMASAETTNRLFAKFTYPDNGATFVIGAHWVSRWIGKSKNGMNIVKWLMKLDNGKPREIRLGVKIFCRILGFIAVNTKWRK